MIVRVAGIENFVGDIKARYRRRGAVSDDPMRHHFDFWKENTFGALAIDHNIVGEAKWHDLIETWEADTRRLFADPVWLTGGCVSYVLYEQGN